MNILLNVDQEIGGVDYHRMLIPHYNLDYKIFQHVKIDTSDSDSLTRELKQREIDIIVFSRQLSFEDNTESMIKAIHKAGTKIVLDIDDYWVLDINHQLYELYKKQKTHEKVIKAIKGADLVTCTNDRLYEHISKLNKNCEILPNAIDKSQPQFKPKKLVSNKFRLGWSGGSNHVPDIELLEGCCKKIANTNLDVQLVLCGFKEDPIYKYFRFVFSGRYYKTSHIKTVSSTDVYNYATGYNHFDYSIIPLRANEFNRCKSFLKVLESAYMDCGVIVSKTLPYTELCNEKNSILVSSKQGFYKAVKKLKDNPSLRDDLKEQLKEDCKPYEIQKVNVKRKQLYESLSN